MTAHYLDASVILRVVLGHRGALAEWRTVTTAVASGLIEVECFRTLDRLRLEGTFTDEELALRRAAVYRVVEEIELVEPTMPVLRRASQPLTTVLGSLDAIHLATALLWQETRGLTLVMATHDRALGTAARASGMQVIGL